MKKVEINEVALQVAMDETQAQNKMEDAVAKEWYGCTFEELSYDEKELVTFEALDRMAKKPDVQCKKAATKKVSGQEGVVKMTKREIINTRARELKENGTKRNAALKQASEEFKENKLDENGKLKVTKPAQKRKSYYKTKVEGVNQNEVERAKRYERLRETIDNFDEKVADVVSGKASKEEMVNAEREVLKEALKVLKVAGWYRIYNKETMAEKIAEVAK